MMLLLMRIKKSTEWILQQQYQSKTTPNKQIVESSVRLHIETSELRVEKPGSWQSSLSCSDSPPTFPPPILLCDHDQFWSAIRSSDLKTTIATLPPRRRLRKRRSSNEFQHEAAKSQIIEPPSPAPRLTRRSRMVV